MFQSREPDKGLAARAATGFGRGLKELADQRAFGSAVQRATILGREVETAHAGGLAIGHPWHG